MADLDTSRAFINHLQNFIEDATPDNYAGKNGVINIQDDGFPANSIVLEENQITKLIMMSQFRGLSVEMRIKQIEEALKNSVL